MIPAFRNKRTILLAAASQTSSSTRSATLDCLGADFAEITLNLGTETNTNAVGPTVVISEGDTTSSFATWSSSCTRTAESLETAHAVRFLVDTRARKRYLKIALTAETTTNDTVTSAVDAILSRRSEVAAGTAALAGSTNDVLVVV